MSDETTPDADETVAEAEDRTTVNPTLGRCRGYEVSLAIRRDPAEAAYPDDFAVSVYVSQADDSNVQIARVDTAHGSTHADRLYLPAGDTARKHDDIDIETPEEAVRYFTETESAVSDPRWREYTKRYDDNHGLS